MLWMSAAILILVMVLSLFGDSSCKKGMASLHFDISTKRLLLDERKVESSNRIRTSAQCGYFLSKNGVDFML